MSTIADAPTVKLNEANDTTKRNEENCDTNKNKEQTAKIRLPDERIIQKFIEGEVIVDKKNPFKSNGSVVVEPKLNGRKARHKSANTVNEDDNEFVTTEDVLKQSKYVKTYIKNPDKYLTYDPAVLARLKFEELKELHGMKPPVKSKAKLSAQTRERLKELKKVAVNGKKAAPPKVVTFKKVSKPNYPDLADIKVKTGTDLDESFFNPEEVTKNAKRFDERAKKLQLSSDDDLEDITEPLTKSDSSDEVKSCVTLQIEKKDDSKLGSFTNTVNSKEFREYLDKKGLILTPSRTVPNGFAITDIHKKSKPIEITIEPVVEPRRTIMEAATPKKDKKPSVFQRLLPVGIFSSKRKTTPKEVPAPKPVYKAEHESKLPMALKRVVLERQSFQGNELNSRLQRSRKSYTDGDSRNVSQEREKIRPSQSSESLGGKSRLKRPQIPVSTARLERKAPERQSMPVARKFVTPKNSKEDLLDAPHSTPIHGAPANGYIAPQISPIPAKPVPNIKANEWAEMKALKERTDRELFKQVLIAQSKQRAQPIYAQLASEPQFKRGAPHRSTVTGTVAVPSLQQQPPRSQSVLDGMVTAAPAAAATSSVSDTPVVMRRKGTGSYSREEILQRVKEFCRKSMNKTPTKLEPKTSPVSYVSVEHSKQAAVPQVPQRVHSLPQQVSPKTPANSPIYAHVVKRNSIQSNVSEQISPRDRDAYYRQRLASCSSDADSVRHLVTVMDSDKVTPKHVYKYRNDVVFADGPIANQYGYIQYRPQLNGRATPLILERGAGQRDTQIYWSPRRNQQGLQASPKYFHPLPHRPPPQEQMAQPGTVVYFKVGDQGYRPFRKPVEQRVAIAEAAAAYKYESGSEAEEVQRILGSHACEEDWQNDKSGRNQSSDQSASDDRRRAARREDPRRHTLGGDMMQYGMGPGLPQQRSMDLEMGTRAQKNKKVPPARGYTPVNQGPLFDDDPGIMSEVETASTGFRRGGKQRSSLPVVRTPSKTLERPLGLVFLQYRSETKRALLPNEITSIDTVRALFVRSFPRQLTMAYLEGPNVKIYIHDANKDMFYELEDVRSHLREIRDRSVLRLFESNEVAAPQVLPGGPGIPQPLPPASQQHWDQDQSYFSEPEFDTEYQHQHIHKSKGGSSNGTNGGAGGGKPAPYYVGASQTLPRGMYSDRNKAAMGVPAKPLRSYGSRGSMGPPFPYPSDQLYSIPDGYSSSPERGTRGSYEEPYYSQYGTRGQVVAPIIDEEQSDMTLTEDQYAIYGMKMGPGPGRISRNSSQMYDPARPEDLHRIRVEHMERQLANLTGLVQKALVNQHPPMPSHQMNPNYLGVPNQLRGIDDMDGHSTGSSTSIQVNGTAEDLYTREKPPKLGKGSCHKSVSFEKSVSFSDDIQGTPKSHTPQQADSKPPKPAIKSSTLPRTSSQERDRLKPPPPPKPLALTNSHPNYRPDIALAPEVYNHLRGLQKKAKDLRMEVRTLRRLSQAQAVAVREDIKDAFMRIRATLLSKSTNYWGQSDQEKTRISREEELYKQEVIRLEKDLSDLEGSVEGLRGEVINRRTRVNMAAVEDMALVLSRASKTVAELKMRFPGLQLGLRNILSNEMEKVVREEKFLKDEPDRLESALRRCKKLTGTLVTLKRLASVQEQRLPVNEPLTEDPPRSAEIPAANKPIPSPRLGTVSVGGGVPPENALDALLDELQTFAKPQNLTNEPRPDDSTSDDSSQTLPNTITTQLSQSSLYVSTDQAASPQQAKAAGNNANMLSVVSNVGSLRRLHSYPSGSDTDTSPPQPPRPLGKPPVPERNAELLSKVSNKRIPPPPPPRTSSRSPLASPTSPNRPPIQRLQSLNENDVLGNGNGSADGSGNSSGNESGNDHVQRQLALEMRHQELLKKQKMLQEQYARLQQISKNSSLPAADIMQLKKTGSESNLPQKMSLSMAATGSMKNLNTQISVAEENARNAAEKTPVKTNKVYETDIL